MGSLKVFLVLLLFSLSGGELLDNEITEERFVGVGSRRGPSSSNLYTLLRDMSAKLAENTRMTQEQAWKLRVLESLKLQQEELAAELRELQTKTSEVDPMKEQLRGQVAELNAIKTRTRATENHVDSLRKKQAAGQVAFSASLLASGSGHTGPFPNQTTLVFRHVFSNIGNAYNPETGLFTAPVKGAYHFAYYSLAGGSPDTVVGLVKNEEHIILAQEDQTRGFGTAANGATLLLEPGDQVFLQLWPNHMLYDNENHFSTFSGHLLFPM